jgi:hypothetical protein
MRILIDKRKAPNNCFNLTMAFVTQSANQKVMQIARQFAIAS